ncbi:MAG: hypothetical protein Q4F65_12025 [Propionibacteriaceae bacterium]|nr:hypothetical protein [Propionibacteriaceae bacterium]
MSTATAGAGSPAPGDLAALIRMGDLAQGWLLDHTFGRCSCSSGRQCRGERIVEQIGTAIYDRIGRDRTT